MIKPASNIKYITGALIKIRRLACRAGQSNKMWDRSQTRYNYYNF